MLIQGDAAFIPFPDQTFHCAVFSPPYWGLRKYQGEQQRVWGGDADCEHEWEVGHPTGHRSSDTHPGPLQSIATQNREQLTSSFCEKCGAYYGALGLEPTPELYIQHIVEIFREVWRVLRPDGTVWLNMGDCYAGSWGNYGSREGGQRDKSTEALSRPAYDVHTERPPTSYAKIAGGNLMLMPHRVAIALQADGWIVRKDVVWWKRNPMPESVAGWSYQFDPISEQEKRNEERIKKGKSPKPILDGVHSRVPEKVGKEVYQIYFERYGEGGWVTQPKDSWRHTSAHEYIFQLVKKMNYHANQEAVREANTEGTLKRIASGPLQPISEGPKNKEYRQDGGSAGTDLVAVGRNPRSVLDVPQYTLEVLWEMFVEMMSNPGDVLDVPTQSYKGAHYATYPERLISPLIRASCPKRCCPECGAPWVPVVEKDAVYQGNTGGFGDHDSKWKTEDEQSSGHRIQRNLNIMRTQGRDHDNPFPTTTVIDYRPTCDCTVCTVCCCKECTCGRDSNRQSPRPVPGIVLDPFIGSGTTGAVARELGRRWVGLDISMEYLDQQAKIRALNWTPSHALDDLPLFEEICKSKDIDK